ncbi:hypothetical protein ACFE04_003252 [Oxalis oulophora]
MAAQIDETDDDLIDVMIKTEDINWMNDLPERLHSMLRFRNKTGPREGESEDKKVEDRFSNLPNAVAHHILSFPTNTEDLSRFRCTSYWRGDRSLEGRLNNDL